MIRLFCSLDVSLLCSHILLVFFVYESSLSMAIIIILYAPLFPPRTPFIHSLSASTACCILDATRAILMIAASEEISQYIIVTVDE